MCYYFIAKILNSLSHSRFFISLFFPPLFSHFRYIYFFNFLYWSMKNIFLSFSKLIYAAFLCNCLSLFLPSLSGSSSLNTPHTHTHTHSLSLSVPLSLSLSLSLSLFPSHSLTQTYFLSLQPLFFYL